jgi:hypothetical protein
MQINQPWLMFSSFICLLFSSTQFLRFSKNFCISARFADVRHGMVFLYRELKIKILI